MFVAAGFWLGPTGGRQAWLAAAFFALGIPLGIIKLLPGSTYLELDAHAFTFCNPRAPPRRDRTPGRILPSSHTH